MAPISSAVDMMVPILRDRGTYPHSSGEKRGSKDAAGASDGCSTWNNVNWEKWEKEPRIVQDE